MQCNKIVFGTLYIVAIAKGQIAWYVVMITLLFSDQFLKCGMSFVAKISKLKTIICVYTTFRISTDVVLLKVNSGLININMKIKIYFILTFLISSFNLFSQEIQPIDTTKWLCNYNYDFIQDSTSKYSIKNDQMVLQIGSRVSKFSSVFDFIADSIIFLNKSASLETFAQLLSRSTSGFQTNIMAMFLIYKNFPKKESLFFIASEDSKAFKVEQSMKMDWKLDANKDSTILGYKCHKASTSYAGRNYIAWFTPQLPLNDGPYKFNGLPGLILKVYDTKKQHSFTLVSIKKVKHFQPIIFHNLDYINITPQEYIKIMQNKFARLYGNIQSGAFTFDSEETKANSMHGLKMKNNFIEKF